MWFSKADGGLEEVVEAAVPTPPLEEDLEKGLRCWKSPPADFTEAAAVEDAFSSAN